MKINLCYIQILINSGTQLSNLNPSKYKMLLVITEAYRQKLWIYENESTRIDNTVVSINQPHIQPLIRKKLEKTVD